METSAASVKMSRSVGWSTLVDLAGVPDHLPHLAVAHPHALPCPLPAESTCRTSSQCSETRRASPLWVMWCMDISLLADPPLRKTHENDVQKLKPAPPASGGRINCLFTKMMSTLLATLSMNANASTNMLCCFSLLMVLIFTSLALGLLKACCAPPGELPAAARSLAPCSLMLTMHS